MTREGAPTMSRKSHKKSRKGCIRCKRRHIKCGEEKPSCRNCVSGEVRCSYLDGNSVVSGHFNPSLTLSPVPGVAPVTSTPAEPASKSSIPSTAFPVQGALNLVHLELLHHAQCKGTIWSTMGMHPEDEQDAMTEVVRLGLANPFLMHELLAYAALHLSVLQPSRAEFLKYQATELQTYALSLFNDTIVSQPTDSLAAFIFSAVLGTHNLHDAISSGSEDFGTFLDRFVNYLGVARGITTQLNGPKWESLRDTPLRGIFVSSAKIPDPATASAPELDKLEDQLRTADISQSSLQVYREALKHLKSAFQAHRTSTGEDRSTVISAIFTFPIRVSPDYTDLLAQRRPEALALLAHFGALMHLYRSIWIFGDGGRILVESVTKYLGTYWEPWLESPLRLLAER